MNVRVFPTYDALSSWAADDLTSLLSSIERPLVCVASGDSPAGLYRTIVQRVQNKETGISNWLFVGLDEWVGMNGNDEGSCRFHLNKQFFGPLEIEHERICFFDGRASNPEAECMRIENFIQQHDGIDVAIIGLGMNGHVGMNEPGTSSLLRSHLSEIDPQTQQAGQKYFSKPTKLSQGLTLGIANLKEAKHILLIANGEHKASIVKRILNENPSEGLPATLLHNHKGLTIYLDKSAAQFISNE